ncbi:MAG: hypothetical protein J6Y82_07280 [Bacteroidales bacterium]|nr:hypothetical protein [Bacteroidales bacterium]
MGGRGAFDSNMGRTGGIPVENRIYSQIGKIDKIKIIQCDTKPNNPTITYSNTANTTYYSYSKENNRIEHIYYYRDHKLFKSVDFEKGVAAHVHYWNGSIVGRKRHDKHNIHALSDKDKRLMNKALKWNRDHE